MMIKPCRGAKECVSFVHVRMYVRSYPAAITEQTHAVYNAAWVHGEW